MPSEGGSRCSATARRLSRHEKLNAQFRCARSLRAGAS